MVWGFPRGKPQLFTDSPRGLSNGVMVMRSDAVCRVCCSNRSRCKYAFQAYVAS